MLFIPSCSTEEVIVPTNIMFDSGMHTRIQSPIQIVICSGFLFEGIQCPSAKRRKGMLYHTMHREAREIMEAKVAQELLRTFDLQNDHVGALTPHNFIDLVISIGYKESVRQRDNLHKIAVILNSSGEKERNPRYVEPRINGDKTVPYIRRTFMLSNILNSLDVSPVAMLSKDMIQAIYLGEVDYSKPVAHFMLAFRDKNGGTVAAYIDKADRKELERVHTILSAHLTIGQWTVVGENGNVPITDKMLN